MAKVEDINKLKGGILVRVERHSTEGTLMDTPGQDVLVGAHQAADGVFAWWDGDRPYTLKAERVEQDGDEFRVLGHATQGARHVVIVSPMWLPAQRATLARWLDDPNTDIKVIEAAVKSAHQATLRSPTPNDEPKTKHTFRVTWLSALGHPHGGLGTIGVLAVGNGQLGVRCFAEFASIQTEWEALLASVFYPTGADGKGPPQYTPEQAFDRLIVSGNGISRDFSDPFEVKAPTMAEALSIAISQSETRRDLRS